MTSEPLEAYYRAELLLSAVSELPARARTKLDDTFDTKALALTTLQANANVQMYSKQCEALDTEHSRVPPPLMCPTIESADPNSTPHSHSPTQLLVVPFIERYLYEKCVTICGFLHADRDISQLENLPIHIMHQKSKLSAEETHCQNLRKEMIKTLTVELDAYKAMICKLVHMLSTFKQLEMPQYLARKTRWLHTLSTLFQTQVQLYRYQLLEQTYTCTKVDTLCKLSYVPLNWQNPVSPLPVALFCPIEKLARI
ncbi:unnamed protein product [Albugo candida]|uniref:Uncharacterized protein n=1 Tax=Albugo candida TaxID=65357 RepID=A0A024GD44_9STRA|nr:unnamed protein product [Albugo candida]|eukprot:CCI44780.1 unnamed protein product [Albugo candida]